MPKEKGVDLNDIDPLFREESITNSDSFHPADNHELIQQALKRFASSELFYKRAREDAEKDVAILDVEEQWDKDIREERRQQDRPTLTFPQLPQHIDQVLGEWRKNRPQIRIRTAAGVQPDLTIESAKDDKKYGYDEVMGGIIREIEYRSQASIAYDWAMEGSVSQGFGHLRVYSNYLDDESFDQDIVIERVHDHFAVHWDPASIKYSREDAEWCFIEGLIDEETFKARYPSALTSSDALSSLSSTIYSGWVTYDGIRVTEYFVKKPKDKVLIQLSDGRVLDKEQVEPVLDELAEAGITIEKERTVHSHVILWYLITALDVLEGPVELDGKYIPVIPVWGKEKYYGGFWTFRSLIRNAHDAQRMYNYERTSEMEQIALAPKAPFILEARQIEGYEAIWKNANTKSYAYLPYRHVDGVGKPNREPPITPSTGHQAAYLAAKDDVKSTIGQYSASLGERSNEKSGKAILARREAGDIVAYPYIDNGSRSLEYLGRILVDLIPKIYSGERVQKIRHEDDTEDTVVLNQTIIDEETGEPVIINDLSMSRYQVSTDIGPSYVTRKLETSNAMIDLAKAVPIIAEVAPDLIILAQDFPNAKDLAERVRKALPPELMKNKDDEQEDQDLVIKQQMQAEADQVQKLALQVDQLKAQAETATAEAKIARAEAEKIKAEASLSSDEHIIEERIMNILKQLGVTNA